MSRLSKGGLIDRSKALKFSFDGQNYSGFKGDTLASALLANDVRLVGRSFKYHRPRGIMTAGSDEPNALMTIARGDGALPNTRATMQELYEELSAHSQHNWPSVGRDFGRLNDYLSRFIGPGFYTKTFMWPRGAWNKLYEPLIRHAAGLGKLPTSPDAALFTKAWAYCDILVVGGGLSGIMSALVAGRAGANVILVNDDFAFGGRALSETYRIDDMPGHTWAAAQMALLRELPNVRLMPRTTIVGAFDGATYAAVERVSDHMHAAPDNIPRQVFWRIIARRVILATGAQERMIAFPDNDRPGVMLSSALRTYVSRYGVAAGKKVAIFTNNNDGWRTARDLDLAQIEIAAVIDTRTDIEPKVATARVITGGQVIATEGDKELQKITIKTASGTETLEVDCLAVSGGWDPSIQLSSHLGGRPKWDEDIAAFVSSSDGVAEMSAVGAAAGKFSSRAALLGGEAEAVVALMELDFEPPTLRLPKAEDGPVEITPFWFVENKGRAWLDFQNDVTSEDLKQSHLENMRGPDLLKRYTTLGMGTDQGRMGALSAAAMAIGIEGGDPSKLPPSSNRAPVTPVLIGAFGAGGAGQDFAPVRHSPVQQWIEMQNAPMMDTGLWHRPSFYPQDKEEHWRQSVDREAISVRTSVGVFDASTLGKFDIQGRDAESFLDRIYCNNIKSLELGRLRYCLMLRDDGFLMDDGVCSKLGKQHYQLTTGTVVRDQVLQHLEFCAQCLWPELEVFITDISEHWAQIAVVGPKSRDVLAAFVDGEYSPRTLPYLFFTDGQIQGVPARLSRISYCGDLGFELSVPARYGVWAMAELVSQAELLGGGAVGLEAVDVLRIEAGNFSHAEMNGQTTAGDLGLAHVLPLGKSFIGKSGSQRVGLNGPLRQQLVGLKPAGAVKQLLPGAHLLEIGANKVRAGDKGHVTSACYSPNLERTVALALLENGRAKIGSKVLAVDPVREIETICEVIAHRSDNPGRERIRGET